jgi:WD40 repeat protein
VDRHFDVFLSYNRDDEDAVHRIAEHLQRERIEPWLDKWVLTPGKSWQDEIVEGLSYASTCAVMVGPSGLGDWAREELAVASDRAAKDRDFRLFLVLLPGSPEITDPRLAFLRTRTWVDMRAGIADPDAFDDLVAAITGSARAPAPGEEAVDESVSPYRGLASFEEDHADFFFGREDDTARVLELLKESRFVAVMGASGSGKSSLVRAGVVRALHSGRLPGSDSWIVRVFTPGARPLTTLAAQLNRAFPQESMQGTLRELQGDRRSLDLAATAGLTDAEPGRRLVLVADQFEELFTLCTDEAERIAFLDNLLYAATIPGGRVVVVVGMRADFYHRCAPYPELRSLISTEQYLVGPLTREGLCRAIEEPARRVGVGLESGLLDTIVADVGAHPGGLPLLQHVLYELWQRRRGRMLTLEAYVAAGRLEGALAKRANAVYQALPPDQQQIARRALLRLVQPGEGTEDTRRRADMDELVSRDEERAGVERVVEALAQERLLTFAQDETSDRRVVDITHEALIRGWPEFRAWIDEERDELRAERRLTEAATEWDEGGRDESLLFRGARLSAWDDRDLGDLNDRERAFLTASRARVGRQARARRAVTATLAVLTALALVAASVALVNLRRADRQTDRAETATRLSTSRRMAAESVTALGRSDQALAALLALGGDTVADTVEASSALASALAADIDPSTVLSGHTADVRTVAVESDGTIVSGSLDATVQIWPPDGRPPTVLRGHEGEILDVAADPDGRRVYSAGIDGTVRMWDVRGGAPAVVQMVQAVENAPAAAPAAGAGGGGGGGGGGRATTPAPPAAAGAAPAAPAAPISIRALAVQPNGDLLAGAGADGAVRLWSRSLNAAPKTVSTSEPDLRDVAWRPDGGAFAVSSRLGTIQVRDSAGTLLTSFKGSDDAVFGLAWSPDGKTLAAVGRDRALRIWDVAAGRSRDIVAHDSEIYGVAYSPSGTRVATASADRRVRIWDPATGQQVGQHLGHSSDVRAVAYDGERGLVSASNDATVRRWTSEGAGTVQELGGVDDSVLDLAVPADGSFVAAAARNGTVVTWSLPDGKLAPPLTGHVGPVFAVVVLPGPGNRLASAGSDGTVRVWDRTSAAGTVLSGHDGPVRSLAAMGDGRLVSGGADGTIRIWDPSRGTTAVATWRGHDRDVLAVAVDPTQPVVASGGVDGTVRIWDADGRGRVIDTFGGEVRALTFSPDGRTLAVAGADGRIRRYDAPDFEHAGADLDHGAEIRDLAYTSDGSVLASAGRDLVVRLWKPDGSLLATLSPQPSDLRAVAFLPGDRAAVSASNDGRVKIWPAPAAWQETACRLAGRDLRPDEWDRYAGVVGKRPQLCT